MLFGMFHRLHYRSTELFLHSMNICKSIQQQMQKEQLQQPKRNAPSASSSNQEKFAAVQSRRLQPHTGACAIMRLTADTPKKALAIRKGWDQL